MVTITTERLVLRPLDAADAGRLFPLFNDWAVVEWLSAPPWPYTFADMDGFIARMIGSTAPDREVFRVISCAGTPIGGISWRERPAGRLQSGAGPNIGYWLGAAHWNRGYMTEAVGGLAGHVFATSDTNAIYSSAFKGNVASLRVQLKLGFVREGETMLRSNPQNADLPLIKTELTRRAFEASNPRKRP
jgi:RimJ/RimL family protein N-acetyltransferase